MKENLRVMLGCTVDSCEECVSVFKDLQGDHISVIKDYRSY